MISFIDRFLKSRLFFCIRIGQFLIALAVFSTFALMPAEYVKGVATSDKSLHFMGNLLLMLSACVALMGRLKLVVLLLLLIPYSIAMEFGQWLSPGRHFDPRDMVANILGLVTGYILVHLVEFIWNRVNQREARVKAENN
ncbi:VanZ family protein [Saccharophagus sp. K07]|jgi:VanZ family protein|uniref:VanZ family protein n=1 Tax=Saccharophagus sp. K07 TaxID=2283636 RepID=UPI0016525E06|nr:VanZ family protein [Saccharophagus sp. K07]MBC6904438.1 VanZ family protein [Saccharophagus sp. K07]